jgi:hypothetical protein
MKITASTLRSILDEFGGIAMTDKELNDVVPVVEAFVAEFTRLEELELGDVDSALQMHVDDGEFSRD